MHAYHAVATCVLASSLTKRAPRYTSPRVPRSGRSSSFGWVEGRRLLVERGSGAEVATFLERHPQYPEDDLQTVLSYFDAALLAPAVGCPTVVGLGVPGHEVGDGQPRLIAGEPPSGVWLVEGPHPFGGSRGPR